MRIIVPIKQVPETNAVKMDEKTGVMVRDGVDAIINPLDLFALELALRLRERHGGEVIAVCMGPSSAVKALREAIAMGCDAGVLASHKAFAGSDTWATARVLSAATQRLAPYDLIICGERATDGDTGQVGPELAAFLDLPVVTYVGKVVDVTPRHDASPAQMTVHRLVEEGHEVLQAQLPAVFTVVKEVAEPRLPTLRGKRKARAAEIPVWGPEELAVAREETGLAGSPTRVVKVFRPKVSRQCEKMTAQDDSSISAATERLVAFLKERALIR